MFNIYTISRYFFKYAFLSRKQIREKSVDDKLINIVDEKLKQTFGENGIKYFGIVFEAIRDQNNPNENINDAVEIIKIFLRIKEHLEIKDYKQYSSYKEFHDKVIHKKFELDEKERNKEEDKKNNKLLGGVSEEAVIKSLDVGDSTKIYEDEENIVFRINSAAGANTLGSDTSWCITKLNQGFYNQYTSNNLLFYFVFNKIKPLSDPLQKVAIRVMKDENKKIVDIKYTKKTNDGDKNEPITLPGYSKYKNILISDAEKQPEGLLSRVKNNRATEQEMVQLWNNNKRSSIKEKDFLLKYIFPKSFKESEEYKEYYENKTKNISDEEVKFIGCEGQQCYRSYRDFAKVDPTLLENIASKTTNEDILLKLYNTNISFIQEIVVEKTKNMNILLNAATSKTHNFIRFLLNNKFVLENDIIINYLIKNNKNSILENLSIDDMLILKNVNVTGENKEKLFKEIQGKSWYEISRFPFLSEEFIENHQDKVDWEQISVYQKLSENFIRKFQKKVYWKYISYYQKLSEDFIREFHDRVYWAIILSHQNLSKNFRIEFQNKIDWNEVSKYETLSEDFIRKNQDKVNWLYISAYQKLSEDFIREFQNKVNWEIISKTQILSEKFIREFQNKVSWILILHNQKLSKEFIKEFKNRINKGNIEKIKNWFKSF